MNISEALELLEREFSSVKISPSSVTFYKWRVDGYPGKTMRVNVRSCKGEGLEGMIVRAVEKGMKQIATGSFADPFAAKICGLCGSENQWSNKVTKKGKHMICHNCANPKTNVTEITSWQNQTIG